MTSRQDSLKIEGGCILLARKLIESPSWQSLKPEGKVTMITLLTLANHKDKKWYNPITKQEVIIKRGQCIIGRKTLARKCAIGEQSVRTALTLLKSTNFLTIKPTNLFSIVTICNYEYYQNLKNYTNQVSNQETNQLLTNLQPTPNQPLTTNNNDNNDKNVKNDVSIASPSVQLTRLTDSEFLSLLKNSPAYKHIDIEAELAKIDIWLMTHRGKQKTRGYIVSWLNRIDKPLQTREKLSAVDMALQKIEKEKDEKRDNNA